ncbi:50S ribosomal protein L33 [Staphylococcus aureus]|nr:50S ribosomal protein L33 [Staphylococcus aureus]
MHCIPTLCANFFRHVFTPLKKYCPKCNAHTIHKESK